MKIDDFLKTKKVRCVKAYSDCLTVGKEYSVLDIRTEVKVKDDEGAFLYWESDHFEPIIESAENPLQEMKLTREFEAVVPHVSEFKAGDPVYWGLKSKIFKIHRIMSANVLEVELDGGVTSVHKDELCPATQENYEKLCSLFERIDFERPPITGDDLLEAMLKKGIKNVLCFDKHGNKHVITDKAGIMFVDIDGFNSCSGLTPIDWTTDEPLTEAVLDE